MIALALQIRILFVMLLLGLALYALWRLGRRLAQDPRLRGRVTGPGVWLLALYLLRAGLPMVARLMRFFR